MGSPLNAKGSRKCANAPRGLSKHRNRLTAMALLPTMLRDRDVSYALAETEPTDRRPSMERPCLR